MVTYDSAVLYRPVVQAGTVAAEPVWCEQANEQLWTTPDAVWRQMHVDHMTPPSIEQSRHTSYRNDDDDDTRLEDEQLLSFVGGLATHAPLNAADDQ
jgi:O-glycosyl hydrolase